MSVINDILQHYSQSHRSYPEILIPVEYNYSDTIRKINSDRKLSVQGIVFTLNQILEGQYIALKATEKMETLMFFIVIKRLKH